MLKDLKRIFKYGREILLIKYKNIIFPLKKINYYTCFVTDMFLSCILMNSGNFISIENVFKFLYLFMFYHSVKSNMCNGDMTIYIYGFIDLHLEHLK